MITAGILLCLLLTQTLAGELLNFCSMNLVQVE